MKFLAFCIFFLLVLSGCGLNSGEKILQIELRDTSKKEFLVAIADDPEERNRGLMFHENLSENRGMFFIFDKPQELVFWMKNTMIPLDIVFIDSAFRITNIQKMAMPCKIDSCPTYHSAGLAQYVLEINGGLSDKFVFERGAKVILK